MLRIFSLCFFLLWARVVSAQIVLDPVVVKYDYLQYSKFAERAQLPEAIPLPRFKKGLASVWCIAQDEDGKMLFGTTSGLLEFDGQQWDATILPDEKVGANWVRSMRYDKRNKRVYIGSNNDFGYVETAANGKRTYTSIYRKFKAQVDKYFKNGFNEIWSTHIYQGEIFFHARFGVFIYNGKSLRVLPTKDSYHRLFLVDQKLFLRQDSIGLTRYEQGQFVPTHFGEAFALGTNWHISGLATFHRGGYLVGTRREGLFLYQENAENKATAVSKQGIDAELDAQLKDAQIYDIKVLADGSYAVSTLRRGIFILDNDLRLRHRFHDGNGLTFNDVLTVFQDKNDRLWCGSYAGIAKITLKTNFKHFNWKNGLVVELKAIKRFKGAIYGCSNIGVHRLNEKTQRFELIEGMHGQGMFLDVWRIGGEERLFVGADNLYEIVDGRAVPLLELTKRMLLVAPYFDERYPDEAYIAIDKDRLLKVQYKQGKFQIAGEIATPVEVAGLGGLTYLKDTGWWATHTGFKDGVVARRYDIRSNRILKTYTLQSCKGAAVDTSKVFRPVVGVDFEGNLVLTVLFKKYIYNAQTDTFDFEFAYNRRYGLPDSCTVSYLHDNDRRLFGLRASTEGWSLLLLPKGKGEYTVDSLPFHSLGQSGYVFVYADDNRESWATSTQGAYRFDGKVRMTYQRPFATYLTQVGTMTKQKRRVYNVLGENAPTVWKLPHNENSLRFDFSVIDFESDERAKYRYKLEGHDAQWSEWTAEQYKEYTNLPAGVYVFYLESRNYLGTVGKRVSFRFEVLNPWYYTYWGLAGELMLFLLVLYAIGRWNMRRLRKQNEYLEGLVLERTREIDLKTEEILAQSEELKQSNDELIANKNELERQRHEVMESIAYGSRIQRAVLPFHDRISHSLQDYFILYKPKDIVSGDFYWFHDTQPHLPKAGKVIMATADCTGHGVPGAFMSMIGHQILYEIVIQMRITAPDRILNTLHKEIRRALRQYETDNRDGMDIGIVVWEKENHLISFAGAKNNLLYIENGRVQVLKGDKRSIGGEQCEEERVFMPHILPLPADNSPFTLYMLSDGYQDQFGGEDNKKFGAQRTRDLLARIQPLGMSEQEFALLEATTQWRNACKEPQTDDILIWGVRFG